jgi:hypothetical protein
MGRPLGPGGTAPRKEFPPRAADWQRLRLPSFSVSTLSELYIENRNLWEFFLYVFVGVACVIGGCGTWNLTVICASTRKPVRGQLSPSLLGSTAPCNLQRRKVSWAMPIWRRTVGDSDHRHRDKAFAPDQESCGIQAHGQTSNLKRARLRSSFVLSARGKPPAKDQPLGARQSRRLNRTTAQSQRSHT